MTVDIESLTMPEFLMMLNWEGNPPDDPAFDKIRMTPEEWRAMFPAAAASATPAAQGEEKPDASTGHPAAAEAAH